MITEQEARQIGQLLCSKHMGRCPDDCKTAKGCTARVMEWSTKQAIAAQDPTPSPTYELEIA